MTSINMDIRNMYKMTFLRHLRYIWISLMFFLIIPVIHLYFVITGQANISFISIFIIWIVLGMFYFVGFKLHYSYYQNDKNKKIIIDTVDVILNSKSDSFSFKIDDIESITNHHSGLRNRTPWNDYEYSVFRLKNGEEVTITCLLMDLEKIIDKFPNKILIKENHFIATLTKKMKTTTN